MRHRVRTTPVPRRPEAARALDHPLAGLPNQALARVLARAPKPDPTRAKVKKIENLYKTIGAGEWADTIKQGKDLMPLYADLATQLGATVIRDVQGTDAKSINFALTVDRVKPGLNLVSRGISKGRCWYIEDGKPVNKLTVSAQGPLPRVAIGVAPSVFVADNKAFALATVRHEIEHGAHRQMAVDWMQKWREAGAPGAGGATAPDGPFRSWLGSQQIALADRQLIGELADGEVKNTEVLAHLEGFITAFPHQDLQKVNDKRAVYDQLVGVAENWASAHYSVKAEAVRRITEMKKAQKGPALKALRDTFTRLKGEKDAPKELVEAVLSAP
jgi:hypothetical protein